MADFFFNNRIVNAGGVKLAPEGGLSGRDTTPRKIIDVPLSGRTLVLDLTGKFAIPLLILEGVASENYTVELHVDGVEIFNDVIAGNTVGIALFGCVANYSTPVSDIVFICDQSLQLYVTPTADAEISVEYIARPIL